MNVSTRQQEGLCQMCNATFLRFWLSGRMRRGRTALYAAFPSAKTSHLLMLRWHSYVDGTVPYSPCFGSPLWPEHHCAIPYPIAECFPGAPFSWANDCYRTNPIVCVPSAFIHFALTCPLFFVMLCLLPFKTCSSRVRFH